MLPSLRLPVKSSKLDAPRKLRLDMPHEHGAHAVALLFGVNDEAPDLAHAICLARAHRTDQPSGSVAFSITEVANSSRSSSSVWVSGGSVQSSYRRASD